MAKVKLVPAVIYKQQIIEESKKLYYTDAELYYVGWVGNMPVNILDEDESGSIYQYAICDMNDKLIGYIAYRLDLYTSQAYNFGLISFDKGNILIGYAVKEIMDKLINKNKVHRIEFRCVGGNPAKKAYDRFCKRYNGRCIELRDTIRDEYGRYHNEYIYEILLGVSE